MNELEDKDFSWSPGYAWRTCLTMMTKRLWILAAAMLAAMILFHWLCPGLKDEISTMRRYDPASPLLFGGMGGYFFTRDIINRSGINPLLALLAELFFIAIVLGAAIGVLHFIGAGGKYMAAACICSSTMAVCGLFTLKEQE